VAQVEPVVLDLLVPLEEQVVLVEPEELVALGPRDLQEGPEAQEGQAVPDLLVVQEALVGLGALELQDLLEAQVVQAGPVELVALGELGQLALLVLA
jgi:hypothetical protein